jgi:hypothetical protein
MLLGGFRRKIVGYIYWMKVDDSMESTETIKEELMQLLETYYNGSFAQMACDYIRYVGMTPEELEQVLKEMRTLSTGK